MDLRNIFIKFIVTGREAAVADAGIRLGSLNVVRYIPELAGLHKPRARSGLDGRTAALHSRFPHAPMLKRTYTNGILILLATLVAGCAGTQFAALEEVDPPTKRAFEGANAIYIRTADSPADAREKIAKIVQTEDLGIVQAESNESRVATGVATFAGDVQGSARYFFEVGEAEGDSTQITATGRIINSNVSDWTRFQQFDAFRLEAGGSRRSVMFNAFRQLMTIVDIYSGGTIYYDRIQ